MIRTSVLSLGFSIYATSSLALSCLAPDVINLYSFLKEDPAQYYIARGTIELLEPAKKATPGRSPEDQSVAYTAARFTGEALTPEGFVAPFTQEIVIEVSCIASWCGSASGLNETYIAGLRIDDEALSLGVGPCGGRMVLWTERSEQRLLACHLNGACE